MQEPVDASALEALRSVLERSRQIGFLGPGDIDDHIANGAAFLRVLHLCAPPRAVPTAIRVLDLGSGGGVPGLVVAVLRPDIDLVLLDAARRRTDFLEQATHELGVSTSTHVLRGRAEEVARDLRWRGAFDVVTARSFGRPAVTLECALGFLRSPGGSLLVSEPPDDDDERWPVERLAEIGVRARSTVHEGASSIRCIDVVAAVPEWIPRRVGVPSRRPLF